MTRNLPLTIVIFLLACLSVKAQETAMDFDQSACGGDQHHLFTELDAGKVVVLDFVMLNCAPCITATKALENIRSPYDEQYPERVILYSMGFLNLYTCAQVSAWKTNNNFTHEVFTGGEQQVSYYGGMGMPTIVVLGGSDHKVYFKSSGYTPALDGQIKAAIDTALKHSPLGIDTKLHPHTITVYPTVSSDYFTFNVNIDHAVLSIFNTSGIEVLTLPFDSKGNHAINAESLPAGLYVARLRTKDGYSEGVKLIKQ